ncbi:hypothetical protein MICRO11B_160062 [Micrococcus luteus]|nr:hypothetical protein MICRO11B_160062 [Micrococcus luteus]
MPAGRLRGRPRPGRGFGVRRRRAPARDGGVSAADGLPRRRGGGGGPGDERPALRLRRPAGARADRADGHRGRGGRRPGLPVRGRARLARRPVAVERRVRRARDPHPDRAPPRGRRGDLHLHRRRDAGGRLHGRADPRPAAGDRRRLHVSGTGPARGGRPGPRRRAGARAAPPRRVRGRPAGGPHAERGAERRVRRADVGAGGRVAGGHVGSGRALGRDLGAGRGVVVGSRRADPGHVVPRPGAERPLTARPAVVARHRTFGHGRAVL